jgi:hypothetical protein
VHEGSPEIEELPGRQLVQLEEPATLDFPESQNGHPGSPPVPVVDEYWPAAHSVQEALFEVEKRPAEQESQDTAPVDD